MLLTTNMLSKFALLAASMMLIFWLLPGAFAASDARRGITADDLLAIRDIKTIAISPDGNHVAFQVFQAIRDRNDYDIDWYVAPITSNAGPLRVADGGDADLPPFQNGLRVGEFYGDDAVWSPDSRSFAYTRKKNGEVQIWRSRFDRRGQEQLTHNAGNVEGPKYSADGLQLFFAVGRDRTDIEDANQREAAHGYLMQEPGVFDIEQGPLWPSCSDGQARQRSEINEHRSCRLTVWVLDLRTGVERTADAGETKAYFSAPDLSSHARFERGKLKDQSRLMETASPDGKRSAWFENEDPAVYTGYYPPMRVAASVGNKIFRCPADACLSTRPEKLWWHADGAEVIFLVRNGPRETLTSLYGWTPGDNHVRTILSSDDTLQHCSMARDRLICGHESWTSPLKIVSVDLHDGTITTIADMNPEFRNFSFTKVEKILGKDAYGNPAHAHLVYPKGYEEGRRYPLVIVQYRSRGFLRGGVGDEVPIHVLAQNGFAVLSFDTPEGDYYTRTPDPLEMQIKYLKYVVIERGPATAIERMVDKLVSRGIVDPALVAITGLSHGASTLDSALLGRNYAAAITAGTSISAPPNTKVSASSFWGKSMDGAFGGSPFSKTGFETRAKYSVGVQAFGIDTPVLFQVADREYYNVLQNYQALRDAGKPVEMFIYPDEYHVKWQPAHRSRVYIRNINWLNFWLRDTEDEDPAKAAQYERWRSLKAQHQANLLKLREGGGVKDGKHWP